MPKSAEEIIAQAEKLADYFEDGFEPAVSKEVAAVRAAAHRRGVAEAETVDAVAHANAAGVPWRTIGEALGTSGEAARQRYSKLCKQGASKREHVRHDNAAAAKLGEPTSRR